MDRKLVQKQPLIYFISSSNPRQMFILLKNMMEMSNRELQTFSSRLTWVKLDGSMLPRRDKYKMTYREIINCINTG